MTSTDLNTEEWRDIPGYEGLYQVSNLGRVQSMKRQGSPGGIKTLQPDHDGYLTVGLSRQNRKITHKVHQLVLSAFVSEKPEGQEVNHKYGIKTDNRVKSLEYNTHMGNMQHARDTSLLVGQRGEMNGRSKLTEQQVREIKELLRINTPKNHIANRYSVSDTLIGLIADQKIWRHVE